MISTHLPVLSWNVQDQLSGVDLQGGGKAFYVYNAVGQRVLKVVEHPGATVEERIDLGGYEVYRKRVAGALTLERETLHVMDGVHRIALVETRTQGIRGAPTQVIRFQLGNHLGSASVEVDDAAQIISYEEFFPLGSTSFQAVDTTREVPPKRYRYTGKERDEESGFGYYGARYYAAWLGRWTSCDPAGMVDGTNLYCYVSNNPIVLVDPTGTEDAPSPVQQWIEKNSTRAAALMESGFDLNKAVPPLIDEEKRASDRGKTPAQAVDAACKPLALSKEKPVRQMRQNVTETPKDQFTVGRIIVVEGRGRYFRGTEAELDDAEWDATYANAVEGSRGLQQAGAGIQTGSASRGMGGTTVYTPSIVSAQPIIDNRGGPSAGGAAGLIPRTLQLNLNQGPTQSNVIRTLRAIGTDEAHATAKLISRGEVQLEFVPGKDPFGPNVAGRVPWGTNKAQIALDKLPRTNQALAALVGHEAFHVVQGITQENYTLTHELEAFTWQAGISGEVNQSNQLEWMDKKYQSLLQDTLVYPNVRRY